MVVGTAHDTIGTVPDLLDVLEFVLHNERGAYYTNKAIVILTSADKRCLALDLFLFDGTVNLGDRSLLLLLLTATRLLLLCDASLLFLVLLLLLFLKVLLLLCPRCGTKPLLVEGLLRGLLGLRRDLVLHHIYELFDYLNTHDG